MRQVSIMEWFERYSCDLWKDSNGAISHTHDVRIVKPLKSAYTVILDQSKGGALNFLNRLVLDWSIDCGSLRILETVYTDPATSSSTTSKAQAIIQLLWNHISQSQSSSRSNFRDHDSRPKGQNFFSLSISRKIRLDTGGSDGLQVLLGSPLLKHTCCSHSWAYAHADNPESGRLASLLHLVEQGCCASGACRAKRMPQSNCSAIHIHLFHVYPQMLHTESGLHMTTF